jgi:predicted HAD superfamily Cof-like phosphohydrolase
MSLEMIEMWHKRARPDPSEDNFGVQLGCHIEEFVEMMETVSLALGEEEGRLVSVSLTILGSLADALKNGDIAASIEDRKEFLDSLADQIVTAVGAGYCAGMNVPEACNRVNESNWSKAIDGEFAFDENGKISKPSTYRPPNLDGLY